MKNFLIVSLLMVYFNSFSQTEIGGFTIVTQAQKEELIVEKELKNFAALVDFVVKKVGLPISEDKIFMTLRQDHFSALLSFSDFNTQIHYSNNTDYMNFFSLSSDKMDVRKLTLFDEYTNLSTIKPKNDRGYIFSYSPTSIFENNQIKELLGGYSNPNYIGVNAIILKQKQLNTAKTPKAFYENGVKFYEGKGQIKNFKTAYNYFKAAADSGYVEAYTMISNVFRYGDKNFQKNVDEALKYAQKAIDLGSTAAYYALGSIYQYDKKDIQTAMQYYEKGVEKGDADSMGILSDMYNTGNEFIRKDRAKAKELAQKACIASQKSENPTDFWCNRLKQF